MALSKRVLNVTINLPTGPVKLDQTIAIRARISKAALSIQNRCVLDVIGLTTSLRTQLLSQFTLWHKRKVDTTPGSQDWVGITIEAGYESDGQVFSSVVFKGEIALVEPMAPPPNTAVRITCFTRQIDKTTNITARAPASTTYYEYVRWAAGQMGFGNNFICDTSFNDQIIENPAQSVYTVSGLLLDIQNMYRPAVAAFVDDDRLIVKDINKVINPTQIATIREFVGQPTWTEWGAAFRTLFDTSLRLAGGVKINSLMNPSLNDTTFVITDMEYDLASRDGPFYVVVRCSPSA